MRNLYLFIIWNKALFQREKILADLEKSFSVVYNIFVEWSDYDVNLKALYGHKIASVKDKLSFIGKGRFNLIVVEDKNPYFEKRRIVSGETVVNANIFDKKDLYREWTGRDFRVHSSQTLEETVHDLTILFGPDYEHILSSFKESEIVRKDTIAIDRINNKKDFEKCLDNLNVIYRLNDNVYELYSGCRLDIKRIFGDSVLLDGNNYQLNIYGEAEGDIPEGLCAVLRKHFDEYDSSYNKLSFYKKYGLNLYPVKKDSLRKSEKLTFFKRLKKEFRYIVAHFRY